MRRSILHLTASLAVLGLLACGDKDLPTSVRTIGARSDAAPPPPGSQIPRPPIRPAPTDFIDITAGHDHTCARRYDKTVYCWGTDGNSQMGQAAATTCRSGPCMDRPTLMTFPQSSAPLYATKIDAGDNHTCIIDPSSDAYCWGDGGNGQLGYAERTFGSNYASLVFGGQKFSQISAGVQSTCGSGPGGFFCWGMVVNRAATPVSLSSFPGAVSLTVGYTDACFMDGTTGGSAVFCFGTNYVGQLALFPGSTNVVGFAAPTTFGPASSVTTQLNFTCVNLIAGTVQCAGENGWGELGNGVIGGFNGTPQSVGGGMALHGVSTGPFHACALDPNGYAYCWGNGNNGEVGSNAKNLFGSPQAVTGGHTYRAIAAGEQHTCAIGTDNQLYCWGQNQYGQLGTFHGDSAVSNPVPARNP